MLIFTHWPSDKRSIQARKKKDDTEDTKCTEFNLLLQQQVGYNTLLNPLPCVFIDNDMNDESAPQEADEQEINLFIKALQSIKSFATIKNKFSCKNVTADIFTGDTSRFRNLIDHYFDSTDPNENNTLINDIYKILSKHDAVDKKKKNRILKKKYANKLAKVLDSELAQSIQGTISNLVSIHFREVFKEVNENLIAEISEEDFIKSIDYSNSAIGLGVALGVSPIAGFIAGAIAMNVAVVSLTGASSTTLALGVSGITALETAGATGTYTMVGGLAATGVGLGIAIVIGAGAFIYVASWYRETLILELSPKFREIVLKGETKQIVKSVAEKTFNLLSNGLMDKIYIQTE